MLDNEIIRGCEYCGTNTKNCFFCEDCFKTYLQLRNKKYTNMYTLELCDRNINEIVLEMREILSRKKIKDIKIKDSCIHCGACESICGDVFKVENYLDDWETKVISNDFKKYKNNILDCVEACPADAIEIIYEDGYELKDKTTEEKIKSGLKYDDEKLNLEILMCHFAGALEKVAEACNYGAKKYNEGVEEKNWSKVENPLSRYRNAFLRHTFQWLKGIVFDKESGVKHIYNMVWNLLVLIEFEIMQENKE